MDIKIKLLLITLILFLAGCQKDDLTLPVRVSLKIRYFSDNTLDFNFTEGQISIKRIEFEGIRETGGNVFFETEPDINFPALEFGLQPEIISDFDIPQGIYNHMRWDIYLKKIVTDELIDYNVTDSLNTGLVIKGYYDPWLYSLNYEPITDSIPFIFAVDDTEQFGVRSYDIYINSRIVLSEDKDYEAILWLNLSYAFGSISSVSFMEAEISGDSEHPVVIISSSKNKDLYMIILDRIFRNAKVIIN